MKQEIKKDSMVEFSSGGIPHGMHGQVKKIYDDKSHVKVLVIPVKDISNPLMLVWRISDVKLL